MKSANQPKPMPPPPLPIQTKAVVPPPKTPATPAAVSTGAAAPTPTLKLKIGGNLTPRAAPPPPPSNNPTTPKTVITVKPKGRKVKPVGTTPAPVVDDGSFDLLEEVIAIEKEKEKLVAKQRQSTAGSETGPPGKRKKDLLDELEEDEEILGLASPSKKPNRSPQPVSGEKEGRAASPAKVPGSVKIKKPPVSAPEPVASSEVKLPAESRAPSNKGKEKEVASPAPARSSAASETPINKAKAREVLKALLRLPEAAIFSRPVDPIQDGCPTYPFFLVPFWL